VAVRWYCVRWLSYRILRIFCPSAGVTVDHFTISVWVQRFTPDFPRGARFCRQASFDRWFVDETYVKVLDAG